MRTCLNCKNFIEGDNGCFPPESEEDLNKIGGYCKVGSHMPIGLCWGICVVDRTTCSYWKEGGMPPYVRVWKHSLKEEKR